MIVADSRSCSEHLGATMTRVRPLMPVIEFTSPTEIRQFRQIIELLLHGAKYDTWLYPDNTCAEIPQLKTVTIFLHLP